MRKKEKIMLARIIVCAVIFFPLLFLEHKGYMDSLPILSRVIIFIIPYAIIGYDIVKRAAVNIKNGQVFDENFLMMIATLGAFGAQEFSEAVAVMLFYQVGELFQSYAVGKSRQSIASMMDMAPEYANLETEDGIETVDPDEVEIGSTIVVKPGEKVPLDGVIIEGESFLDTSALTGESVPRSARCGDEIISGCINGSGTLRVSTTKEYDDSTVARILELVENAGEKKAKVENFITKFARYYTPAVTIGALLLVIFGPVISGGGISSVPKWLLRACTFLVVSCPCALVISVPMGFFGGIGAASKKGILVKGSNYLELAAKVTTVVFDKTGTLTKGEFRVSKVIAADSADSEDDILALAAHGESCSNHPIAGSILDAYRAKGGRIDMKRLSGESCSEEAGFGISALIDGKKVLLGNEKLLKKYNVSFTPCSEEGTVIYVAADGSYIGAIVISDTVKEGAAEAIAMMKKVGIKKTVMLTGDRTAAANSVAKALSIDEFHAQLLPADKVSKVEELITGLHTKSRNKSYLAFVGDGINDAPVLNRADVGIAMGTMGSDAAIEAADIVLMDDDVRKIAALVRISRRTLGIVRQNIVFALTVKFLVLILSAFGIANMWAAVFADVGVAVLAILNSMRALK